MTTDPPLLLAHPVTVATLEDLPLDWGVEHADAKILSFADGSATPQEIRISVHALWNARFLFVLFAGYFQRLRVMPPPRPEELQCKTPGLWDRSDVFEAFLGVDARRTRRYFEFQVAPDGRWFDVKVDNVVEFVADDAWGSGILSKGAIDTDQGLWRAALAIPWTVWGDGPTPLDGNFFRASGAFHGDELLTWSATGYGDHCFHRPDRFGRVFSAQPRVCS